MHKRCVRCCWLWRCGCCSGAGISIVASAIAADDTAALSAALAKGADANAVLEFGETPLARAVETQDPALVAALQKQAPGRSGRRAWPDAAAAGVRARQQCDRAGFARGRRGCASGRDGRGNAAGDVRAGFPMRRRCGRCCARGASADSADVRGQTPLMWAVSAGQQAAASALVQAGAAVNQVTANGFTPLFFALASGKADVVSALIAAGAGRAHPRA